MISAYILDGLRLPRATVRKGQSAYSQIHPQELLSQTLKEVARRRQIKLSDIDCLYVGCVTQVKEQGANLARNAALSAGWPVQIPAMTLNMCCGSGLQAVNLAASSVMSGASELMAAGGVEGMSRVPMSSDGGEMDGLNMNLRHNLHQVPQGISADLLATKEGFSRIQLDQFACESHRKAAEAIRECRFDNSLCFIKDANGNPILSNDNHVRPDTNIERLSELRASFEDLGKECDPLALQTRTEIKSIHHMHTAGNSSGIADGAAAVLVCSKDYALKNDLRPRAYIRSMAAIGSDPILMLAGPSICCAQALAKADLKVSDIDLWEINEAFAAVPLETMRKLGISPERVNVNGGAIALGHPLGATGAILLLTLLDELERRDLSIGAVTLCVAGGQSVTTIIERTA